MAQSGNGLFTFRFVLQVAAGSHGADLPSEPKPC